MSTKSIYLMTIPLGKLLMLPAPQHPTLKGGDNITSLTFRQCQWHLFRCLQVEGVKVKITISITVMSSYKENKTL